MQKNLHDKPFDEGTIKKLDIFEAYTKQWLPTFVMNDYESDIYIFDLFAGPGYSITSQEGSPIRILKQVNNQIGNIFSKVKHIHLLFNEFDKAKVEKLKEACNSYCNSHKDLQRAITVGYVQYKILNTDVALLFPKVKDFLGKHPLLLFLDQNGIKFMADTYLQPLLMAKKVDFLFYLSSSYFNRFGNIELTKIMKFQQDLRTAILSLTIRTNKDAYDYALNHGHLPAHASEEIKRMKKEKKITFDNRSPLVTYENVYKNKNILEYKLCGPQK